MRKRERENPCAVCGHYHKYEEGEVCGICGHRSASSAEKTTLQVSAFPSEILPEFLYLGSYDNASRSGLLKTLGISRVLNTVPCCQNLYKNSFTYHCLQDDKILQFDHAIQFLGQDIEGRKSLAALAYFAIEQKQCERDRARVLVHCMFGKNRSAAVVIAYLMKSKGWRLAPSYQWVTERRPSVNLTEDVHQQLQEYERKIFGSVDGSVLPLPTLSGGMPSFSFGYPKVDDIVPVSVLAFNSNFGATSLFSGPNIPPHGFSFGAGQTDNVSQTPFGVDIPKPNGNDIPMDSS